MGVHDVEGVVGERQGVAVAGVEGDVGGAPLGGLRGGRGDDLGRRVQPDDRARDDPVGQVGRSASRGPAHVEHVQARLQVGEEQAAESLVRERWLRQDALGVAVGVGVVTFGVLRRAHERLLASAPFDPSRRSRAVVIASKAENRGGQAEVGAVDLDVLGDLVEAEAPAPGSRRSASRRT